MALFALVLILNSMLFIEHSKPEIHNNKTFFTSNKKVILVKNILNPFVKFHIPYFIMVGLNIKVVLRLRESKKQASRGIQRRGTLTNLSKFTVSTILIDLIYLVFKAPLTFFQIYSNVYRAITGHFVNESFDLIWNVFLEFPITYSALLVFIFILFNRLFRNEILSFFRFNRFST